MAGAEFMLVRDATASVTPGPLRSPRTQPWAETSHVGSRMLADSPRPDEFDDTWPEPVQADGEWAIFKASPGELSDIDTHSL